MSAAALREKQCFAHLCPLQQEDVLVSLDLSRTIFARIRLNYVWVSVDGHAKSSVLQVVPAASDGDRGVEAGQCWVHGLNQASDERPARRIHTSLHTPQPQMLPQPTLLLCRRWATMR